MQKRTAFLQVKIYLVTTTSCLKIYPIFSIHFPFSKHDFIILVLNDRTLTFFNWIIQFRASHIKPYNLYLLYPFLETNNTNMGQYLILWSRRETRKKWYLCSQENKVKYSSIKLQKKNLFFTTMNYTRRIYKADNKVMIHFAIQIYLYNIYYLLSENKNLVLFSLY